MNSTATRETVWDDTETVTTAIEPLELLRKDLREAAKSLTVKEVRYIVDLYYQWQDLRINTANQVKALSTDAEPCLAIQWTRGRLEVLEDDVKAMLDVYTRTEATGMGRWARAICGVGPVIAAGLCSYLDGPPPQTVGHWWRWAGLDPTNEWLGKDKAEKVVEAAFPKLPGKTTLTTEQIAAVAAVLGRDAASLERQSVLRGRGKPPLPAPTITSFTSAIAKRPWNAGLKVLLFKLGDSFVKVQNHDSDVYGHAFAERKAKEWLKNLNGDYADQAARKLSVQRIGADTDARLWYSGSLTAEAARTIMAALPAERMGMAKRLAGAPGSGVAMLPPAHIHSRARRWAVKLFLAHYHAEAYRRHYGTEPPLPYAVAILGHAHIR